VATAETPTGPRTVLVSLAPPLAADLADELRSRILFVDADIDAFDLVLTDGEVTGVELECRGSDDHSIRRKVRRLVDEQIRPQILQPAKTVWRSQARRTPTGDLFGQLQAVGWVSVLGEGQVAVAGPVLALVRVLDQLLVRELRALYDVVEYAYPTLIPSDTLRAAGYFRSFPHHLMFVTRLHNDLDVYQDFERELTEDAPTALFLSMCKNADYCLPPTMCYHTFAQHAGQALQGFRAITARGKSFRHEAGYHTTLERLWDFTIREMVFLGSRKEVLAARQRVIEAIQALIERLGLEASCQVANDPFFGSGTVPDAIGSQRMLELKYEMRLPIGPGADVAVGSFNFHDDVFGRRFEIAGEGGDVIRSACVGFGLERFAFAVLSQHGTAVDGWPAELAEAASPVGTDGTW
jgi:seryl-tRNA synthetase